MAKGQYKFIAIGSSTGGPRALYTILSQLPADFSLPFVVVQHIPAHFQDSFIGWLNDTTTFTVTEAKIGETLKPGHVYIAPPSHHMIIEKSNNSHYKINLTDEPVNIYFTPSVDVLFESIAKCADGDVIAGLLSGMGNDGAQGLYLLRKKGCVTFVQDKATSVIDGMSSSAIKLRAVDSILPLNDISLYLKRKAFLSSGGLS